MSRRHPRLSKPPLRGEIKQRIRAHVAERDGQRCHYCRQPFGDDLTGATLDHYIPHCLWPTNKPRNLVLACAPCNQAKADRLPLFLAVVLCPPEDSPAGPVWRWLACLAHARQTALRSTPQLAIGRPLVSTVPLQRSHRSTRLRQPAAEGRTTCPSLT